MIQFTEIQNEAFKQVYLDCLYCRTELIQFNYPYEIDAEDYAIGEHLEHCNLILAEYLADRIPGIASENDISLTNEQINELIRDRMKYIKELTSSEVNKYVEEVEIIYIN